jgi:uncharacterized membrane protein YhiD involved in acid resistance
MTDDGRPRRGVYWGAAIGLVIGLMVMWVGLGWTIFLAVVAGLGAAIGSRLDTEELRSQWEEFGQRLEQWWSERGR